MISKIRAAMPAGSFFYLGLALLSTLVTSTTAPLLPVLRDAFSLNTQQIGLLASIGGAGMVLIDLPAGRLIVRLGTRRMAALGLVPVVLGPLLMATAASYGQLLAGSALSGIGFAVLLSNNIAAFSGVGSHRSIGTRMGTLSTVQLIGTATGPLLSGTLAGLTSWRGAYAVVSALAVGGSLAAAWQYPRIADIRGPRAASIMDPLPSTPSTQAARSRPIATILTPVALASFLYFVSVFSRSATVSFLLPIIGRDEAHFSVQMIGLLLGSAVLITVAIALPTGVLADRHGIRQVLLASLAVLITAEALMLLMPTATGLTIAVLLFGLAGSLSSLTYTLYGVVSRRSSSTKSLGSFRLFGDLGSFLGPFSMGLLLAQLGYRQALLSVLSVGLLALVFLARDIGAQREVGAIFEPGE